MPLQSIGQIETDILELCSEDDWGSWELWWNISADASKDERIELKGRFVSVVSELVIDGKLITKAHAADGNIAPIGFDRDKLAGEIDSADNPDPDSFFWFGTE